METSNTWSEYLATEKFLTFGTLPFHLWRLLLSKRTVAFRMIEPSWWKLGCGWMDISCFVKHQNLFVKKHLVTHAPKDLIAHVSPNLPFQLWLTFWEKYMETSFIRGQLSNQISTSVIHPWSRDLHQARFFSVKSWLRSGFHEPPMQARMEKSWRKSMGWKIFRIKPFETSHWKMPTWAKEQTGNLQQWHQKRFLGLL